MITNDTNPNRIRMPLRAIIFIGLVHQVWLRSRPKEDESILVILSNEPQMILRTGENPAAVSSWTMPELSFHQFTVEKAE